MSLYQIMAGNAMNQRKNRRAALLAPLLVLLASCSGDTGQAAGEPPLAGARIGGPFTLTDQNGQQVSDTDFKGNYRIVYFGYTYCPDVCPVDVQKVGAAMRILEKTDRQLADRIVPIFISVDPERDGPAELKAFAANFHPRMVALTGEEETLKQVARSYGAVFGRVPSQGATGYLVDHTRSTYLMGPDGKPIALLPHDETPEAIAAEIRKWAR